MPKVTLAGKGHHRVLWVYGCVITVQLHANKRHAQHHFSNISFSRNAYFSGSGESAVHVKQTQGASMWRECSRSIIHIFSFCSGLGLFALRNTTEIIPKTRLRAKIVPHAVSENKMSPVCQVSIYLFRCDSLSYYLEEKKHETPWVTWTRRHGSIYFAQHWRYSIRPPPSQSASRTADDVRVWAWSRWVNTKVIWTPPSDLTTASNMQGRA